MLTFPYVTRVLGPANLGICNFVDSIIYYFLMASMLGIGSVGLREIAKVKNDPEKLSSVFSSLIVINVVTTALALIVLFVCVLFVPQFHEYRSLMWVGATKILFNTLLIEWFYKGLENFKYITNRSLVVRTLYVLCVFLFVRDSDDFGIYYLLQTLIIVFNAVFNIFYARKFVTFSFKNLCFKPYLGPIIIMGLYSLLTSMYTTFNTMYLGFAAGEVEVGYYSTATKLYNILLALFTAFTGVMLPRMSSILSEGRFDEFKRLLNRSVSVLFSFAVPVAIMGIVYAQEIIYIVAGKDFGGAVLPMQISMPMLVVVGYEQIIIIQGLLALDKNKAVLINSSLGALTGILGCILLMHPLKSIGAAITWDISEVVVLVSASIFIYRYASIKFPIGFLMKSLLLYSPLGLVLYFLHISVANIFISVCLAILVSCMYVLFIQYYVVKEPMVINFFKKYVHRLL